MQNPNPVQGHEPDPMEKRIRFGCGFLFGLVIGLFEFARVLYTSAGLVVAVSAVSAALVCCWLAMKYGDRFWTELLSRWQWWM
jgi:hypothetical protein